MVWLKVQRVEVEVFCFHLWAFSDFPTHADEDVGDALVERSDWVQGTSLVASGSDSNIDGFCSELLSTSLFFQNLVNFREVLFSLAARHVNHAAGVLALIFWQGSKGLACLGYKALVSQMPTASFLQLLEGGRRIKCCDGLIGCSF